MSEFEEIEVKSKDLYKLQPPRNIQKSQNYLAVNYT
jgi:hypothetical protein